MKKHIEPVINTYKMKNQMLTKNTTGKKSTPYLYTESDLGEGLLHAGVSQFYWINEDINKKFKSDVVLTRMAQKNILQNNLRY
jgi:hypothetical protein